ncbi:MAG: ABC transporter permease [Chloroflexi bacterium]|nr:ABC transporter permease [Chloroflexota bacterium]
MTVVARPLAARAPKGFFGGLGETLRLIARRPTGLMGLVGVVFIFLLAFVGPIVIPYDDTVDVSAIYQSPSLAHLLGTDSSGRDVWVQIVHGGKDMLVIGLIAALVSTFIAVTFGALAATVGGAVDTVIVSLTDILLTIPRIPLLVVAAAVLRFDGLLYIALLLGFLGWAGLLRQIRAQVLSLKERDYVEAARSLDLGIGHVIFREILPSMRSYIVIHFIFAMTNAMYGVAGLLLLGLLPLSGNNWGLMLNFASVRGAIFFRDSLWYILSPILAIVLLQLSLVWLAAALEDLFNPRLQGSG